MSRAQNIILTLLKVICARTGSSSIFGPAVQLVDATSSIDADVVLPNYFYIKPPLNPIYMLRSINVFYVNTFKHGPRTTCAQPPVQSYADPRYTRTCCTCSFRTEHTPAAGHLQQESHHIPWRPLRAPGSHRASLELLSNAAQSRSAPPGAKSRYEL